MKNKKIYLKCFVLFLIFAMILTFFSKSFYNYRLPDVLTTNPKSGSLKFGMEGTAEVGYAEINPVYSEADGIIRDIFVKPGDEVKKGQEIMQIYMPDSKKEEKIGAVCDGIISQIEVEKGMYVSYMMNQILYRIANLSGNWEINLLFSEEECKDLQKGNTADIYLKSQDIHVKGEVHEIIPYADDNFSGYTVMVMFQLQNDSVAHEKADVTIETEKKVYDYLVPLTALHEDTNGYYIYVLQKDDGILGEGYKAERISVDLLDSNEENCAVEGLTEQDIVILAATKEISNGDHVYYVESEKEDNV